MVEIVIPFYNAKPHILKNLEQNFKQLLTDKEIPNFKIILVNDGSISQDFRPFIARFEKLLSKQFIFVDLIKNKGKGGAIKEGMKYTTAEQIIFYDIDFPFGKDALYQLYRKIMGRDIDIVISRRDTSYNQKLPWERKIISTFVRKIIYWLSKGKIKDSQAGLKGFHRKVLPTFLATESNSFMIDFEFLLNALKQGFSIDEIIVTPNENIEFTNFSNKTLWKELKTFIKILLKRI